MQQVLYLRRLRDFGEKISDTFLFLKRNGKILIGAYAVFVIPFFLIAIIVGTFFANHLYASFSFTNISASDVFTSEFFLIILCFMLAGTAYTVSVNGYFRLYNEQNGQPPTIRQLGQIFARKFFKVFFYNIIVTIIVGILIVLPAIGLMMIPILGWIIIFFGGILALAFLFVILFSLNNIFVAEDVGLSESVGRLFYLLGGRWWSSVGFMLVIFLIYSVVAVIITIVSSMIGMIFSINFIMPRLGADGNNVRLIVLLLGLRVIIQNVFYLVVFCGSGINYYSLTEEKDGSGIEEQIDSIGLVTDKYGGVEEQY